MLSSSLQRLTPFDLQLLCIIVLFCCISHAVHFLRSLESEMNTCNANTYVPPLLTHFPYKPTNYLFFCLHVRNTFLFLLFFKCHFKVISFSCMLLMCCKSKNNEMWSLYLFLNVFNDSLFQECFNWQFPWMMRKVRKVKSVVSNMQQRFYSDNDE